MKKKVLTAVLAGALSISMVIPAFATNVTGGEAVPSSDGTKVYAGVMLKDPDAKILVEVPTLFAFVVNGSVTDGEDGAVTSTNGGIMLPNVKVTVEDKSNKLPNADPGASKFYIETVGEGAMKFTNYSTKRNEDHTEGSESAPRVGLDVKVNGFIENKGDAASRNHWEHIANAALEGSDPLKGNKDTFKKYTISIDGEKFNVAKDGGFVMNEGFDLGAPNLGWTWDTGTSTGSYTNMNDDSNLAETGFAKTTVFGVEVGGQKNQYRQVEQSAKVGTIVWTISAEVNATKEEGIYTAPDNDYLDGVLGSNSDPDGEAPEIPVAP